MLDASFIPALAEGVEWREHAKGVVINPMMALNDTAATIFRLIDGERTVGAIAGEIARQYDAPADEVLPDTIHFIEQLIDKKIVRPHE
ncbi:uncharacterized protein SOCEGT47_078630 [Sorangium cellulosum]|uniref:Pyrroloquinoline quinone biosynthesis protein PqqD n=1 Tax=Sorangium cellulosum TaxID=56 RepID=A0A4P2QCA7_SORCE|nr:PqqD family protein [Sorangium cellulosum]AUX27279.1 uncharacterized protein SOCEGT47_078630 [Sorangium cellulosum]